MEVEKILEKVCNTVRIFPEQDDEITIAQAKLALAEWIRGHRHYHFKVGKEKEK